MIPVAKEVQAFLLAVGIFVLFIHYQFGIEFTWLLWLVLILLIYLFRDFKRSIPAIPLAVVSPVDGKVNGIDEIYDPYLKRVAMGIRIRQSLFGEVNVHSPIEGKVQNIWVTSPTTPEYPQLAIWVQTDEADDAIIAANLSSKLRHASCKISAGEKLGQGQRCGFMAFYCEVIVYLPASAHIDIKEGQLVRAGSDKLAEFVHES